MKCHCCGEEYKKSKLKTYTCPNCGHVYQNWGQTKEWVEQYYQTYRKTNPIPDKKDRNVWCDNISNFLKDNLKLSDQKILEIGSYDGTLMQKIIRLHPNCEPHVNDIDLGTKKNLEKIFKNIHICDFMEIQGQYDVLVAMDVWEHFDDVSEFYNKVLDLNCEYLFLQVPINRKVKPDNVNFRPHYHLPCLKSFTAFWENSFNLLNYKITEKNFSARGQELLTIFKKK